MINNSIEKYYFNQGSYNKRERESERASRTLAYFLLSVLVFFSIRHIEKKITSGDLCHCYNASSLIYILEHVSFVEK
jgi:hypothetical protein